MISLLEKAFAKASDLPRALQQQLARQILEDVEGMARKVYRAKRKRKTNRT